MMKLFKFLSILLLIPSICFGGASSDFVPGNDDRFTMGDVTTFDGATSLTISAYFILDDAATGRIITKWGNSSNEWSFLFERAFTDEVQLAVGNSGTLCAKYTSAQNMTTGVWYFATGVWSGGTTMAIYVDGASVSMSTNFCNSIASVQNSPTSFNIGNESDENADGVDGKISYVGIYNRALTDVEVAELRFKPESIVGNGAWSLWDIRGGAVKDLSGTGNDGTASATTGAGPDESSLGPPVMFGGGLPL